jgi:hypothetical protein
MGCHSGHANRTGHTPLVHDLVFLLGGKNERVGHDGIGFPKKGVPAENRETLEKRYFSTLA